MRGVQSDTSLAEDASEGRQEAAALQRRIGMGEGEQGTRTAARDHLGRRPSCLQWSFCAITSFVLFSAFAGPLSSPSDIRDSRTPQRRLLLADRLDLMPSLRTNLTQYMLDNLPPTMAAEAELPASALHYSQPMVDGEPEYECTHSWFHPCTEQDNATGPPFHMIQPGRLSEEDQEMFRVLRKLKEQREATAQRIPFELKKVAFMFLTKGPLPFAPLWDRFFQGFEGKFNVYVHTAPGYRFPPHTSLLFRSAQIRSERVLWGSPTMIDAERRLLGMALADPSNHHFVLLSESCIPVRGFDEVWDYLMNSTHSFVANYWTKQKVCAGRYSKHMQPEIQPHQWRKGLQWMSLTRDHALLAMDDDAVYSKMEKYCRGDKWHRHCYMDEHYFPTLLHIKDGEHMANRTITFTDFGDWSIHPRTFKAKNVNEKLIRWITEPHDLNPRNRYTLPCSANGKMRTCYLFARKFSPSALPMLMAMPPDVLGY